MRDIKLFEAIYSARSLRYLKPDAVPDELITRILDTAIRAPSAGNAQSARVSRGQECRQPAEAPRFARCLGVDSLRRAASAAPFCSVFIEVNVCGAVTPVEK
jgi:Nitroreductase family